MQAVVEPGLTLLRADRGTLFTLLKNLLGNAIQHSHAGGAVQRRAKTNLISVQDEGPGVSPDNFPKLGGRRLSTLLYVDCALMRERLEPEDAVIAAHAALIDTTERQLAFQVMREESVDRHAAR